jgi:hypothetical protein
MIASSFALVPSVRAMIEVPKMGVNVRAEVVE